MQNLARHLYTFHKVSSDSFPDNWIIVKYDAFLMHADELRAKFAPKSRCIMIVLHYVEHSRGPTERANLGVTC